MIGLLTWHQGRCGSSVLGSLLGQHSLISAHNEIFSQYMPRRRGNNLLPSMAEVFSGAVTGDNHCLYTDIEIKYLLAQNLSLYPFAPLDEWLHCSYKCGYLKHILIHRSNGLRRICSHVMAQKTGVYISANMKASFEDRFIELDCSRIQEGFESRSLMEWLVCYEKSYLNMFKSLQDWCSLRGLSSPLVLFYERDIEANPLKAYGLVCDYLGLSEESPDVRLRRLNPQPLSSIIVNWNEVCDLLCDTDFAWMLTS